jgi:hypothetical protein
LDISGLAPGLYLLGPPFRTAAPKPQICETIERKYQPMKKILMFLFLWGSMILLPGQSFQWAYHAGGSPNGPDDERSIAVCATNKTTLCTPLLFRHNEYSRLNNIPINLPSTGLTYNYSFLVLASYDCEGNLRWFALSEE